MVKFAIEDIEEATGTGYPAEYAGVVKGRHARRLGMAAGLTGFGVNLVRLEPGAWSSQRHWHTHEDEFVMMMEGEAVLVTDEGETVLHAGDCAGFRPGWRMVTACRTARAPTASSWSPAGVRTQTRPSIPTSIWRRSRGVIPTRTAFAARTGRASSL